MTAPSASSESRLYAGALAIWGQTLPRMVGTLPHYVHVPEILPTVLSNSTALLKRSTLSRSRGMSCCSVGREILANSEEMGVVAGMLEELNEVVADGLFFIRASVTFHPRKNEG